MFCLQHMFDQLINNYSGIGKVVISNSRWILKIPAPMLRSKQASLLAIFLKGTRPTCFLEQKHMLWYNQTLSMAGWRSGDTIYSGPILVWAAWKYCCMPWSYFVFSSLAFLLQPWFLQSHAAENWLLRPRHTMALTLLAFLAHCFKGCFGLGTMSQEAKKKRERLGARCQERFLLDPADPWTCRNPWSIGCKACRSAGLSGKFASYGVSTIGGLQAVNFKKYGDHPGHKAAVQKLLLPDE